MLRRPVLVLATACAALPAMDIPGGGRAPLPVAPDAGLLWFGVTNDTYGAPTRDQRDDFRTNRLVAGWQMATWLRLVADHSILVDENPTGNDPDWSQSDPLATYYEGAQRSDELTVSLVGVVGFGGDGIPSIQAWIGPGVRVAGDLGGEALQNATHQVRGLTEVDYPYAEVRDRAVGLLAAGAEGILGDGPVGLWWSVEQTWTTGGAWSAAAQTRLRAAGSTGSWWIGPGWVAQHGTTQSTVADSVAENEAGPWLEAGIESGFVSISMGKRLDGEAVYGALSLVTDQPPAPGTPGRWIGETAMSRGYQALTGPGDGVMATLRIPVEAGGWWDRRLSAGGSVRRFEHDVPYGYNNRAESVEVLAVVDLSFNPPDDEGFTLDPYLNGGLGWYWGRARTTGSPAVSEDADLSVPRVHGGCGARLWYARGRPGAGGWAMALGGGLDAGWSHDAHTVEYDPTAGGAANPPPKEKVPDGSVRLGGFSAAVDLRLTALLSW